MGKKLLVISIFIAVVLRLFLAFAFYGSFDVDNAWYITEQFFQGKNIYETTSYNHTPLWLVLLIISRVISTYSKIPFYAVMKIYAISADIIIGILIYQISRHQLKLTRDLSNFNFLLYLFSPIPIIISSMHGQFDSVSIALLLASYIVLVRKKSKPFLSAILLGLSVAFKTWPVFLVPLYLTVRKLNIKQKLKYLMIVIAVFFLPITPYFFISLKLTLSHILLYFGTADFGLAVFLQYFINKHAEPLYTLANIFYSNNALLGRIILFLALIITFLICKYKKLNFFDSVILIILSIYCFSLKLGAQYLLWIVPFALLTKYKKITIIYMIATTIILLLNYQGNNSLALSPTKGFEFLRLPIIPFPWGFSVFLWWLICLIWYIKIIFRSPEL